MLKMSVFCLILVFFIQSAAFSIAPGDGFYEGWARSPETVRFENNSLYNYIDGGAELFIEFGFMDLEIFSYRNKDNEIILELYRMESNTSALGIYLMLCGNENPLDDIKARNSGNNTQIIAVKGKYLIIVNNMNGRNESIPVMKKLAQKTLESLPEGEAVKLTDYLSKENLINGSLKLIRGPCALKHIFVFGPSDILLLKGITFAISGNYKSGKDDSYTRIIIPYPDSNSASEAYINLLANIDSYIKILKKQDKQFIFMDYKNQFGIVEIKENIMDIRVNLSKEP